MLPLRLSDAQLAQLRSLAAPIPRQQRALFLQLVADLLADAREIGDGDVHRAGIEAQRECLR